ncbi:MAG TPA: class I SAM-dependent methyltransferase [Tepidisphaeraceae bacterium]|jgi:2-polyprenyl-3-methyl-5-hydroxy-6-metoxy-1,4-benzoquinol methylase|nr:class I SAM-dependent methyltransferase [Tepidisphaeraceae bacterium]
MEAPIPAGFELVNCPGCSSDKWTPARVVHDWALDPTRQIHIVRCNVCGLHFTNPRPDAEHLPAYYPSDYHCYQPQRGENRRRTKISTAVRAWVLASAYGSPEKKPRGWHAAVAAIVTLIKPARLFGFGIPYRGQGRLLDFGCGNGTFLRRMASVGWNVTGLDIGADAVAAVAASGIPAFQGTLPHPALPLGAFDVVTMRQALEHVTEPRPVLKAAFDLLRPGGHLVIDVPNYDSWEVEYFDDAAQVLDVPRHVLHFTCDTLRNLLVASGFKVLDVRQVSRASWIRKSAAHLDRRAPKKYDWLVRTKIGCALAAYHAKRIGKGDYLMATAEKPN